MPKSKKGYVSIALPPNYLLAAFQVFNPKGAIDLKFSSNTVYSQQDIDDILTQEQAKRDLHRTPWILSEKSKKKEFFHGDTPASIILAMCKEANNPKNDLNLTVEETAALFAFGVSSEKKSQQGGLFTFPEIILNEWFNIHPMQNKGDIRAFQVLKKSEQKRDILYHKPYSKFNFLNETIESSTPLIIYSNRYEMRQKYELAFLPSNGTPREGQFCIEAGESGSLNYKVLDDDQNLVQHNLLSSELKEKLGERYEKFSTALANKDLAALNLFVDDLLKIASEKTNDAISQSFTLKRIAGQNAYTALVEEKFFYTRLIPAALEKLKNSQFSDEDLLFFIPLLDEPDFAQAFLDKFLSHPVSLKTRTFLLNYTNICFGNPTFWQQHQGKIFFSAANFSLAAILITALILPFGIEAAIAAVGGMVLLSLAIAAVTLVAAFIGGIMGYKMDNERLPVPYVLEQINQLNYVLSGDLDENTIPAPIQIDHQTVDENPTNTIHQPVLPQILPKMTPSLENKKDSVPPEQKTP